LLTKVEFEDPTLDSIKQVSPLFASCLKERFAPFINGIFQSLLNDASLEVSTLIVNTEEVKEVQTGGIQLKFEVHGQAEKSMIINAV